MGPGFAESRSGLPSPLFRSGRRSGRGCATLKSQHRSDLRKPPSPRIEPQHQGLPCGQDVPGPPSPIHVRRGNSPDAPTALAGAPMGTPRAAVRVEEEMRLLRRPRPGSFVSISPSNVSCLARGAALWHQQSWPESSRESPLTFVPEGPRTTAGIRRRQGGAVRERRFAIEVRGTWIRSHGNLSVIRFISLWWRKSESAPVPEDQSGSPVPLLATSRSSFA
jgi:hypothetical protein